MEIGEVFFAEAIKSAVSVAKDLLLRRVEDECHDRGQKSLTRKRIADILEKTEFSTQTEKIPDLAIERLERNLSFTKRWSTEINLSDLLRPKSTSDVFVSLETYLIPVRMHVSKDERVNKKDLVGAIYKEDRHSVILGQPGAGKTTTIRKICLDFLANAEPEFFGKRFIILIRLRDLKERGLLDEFYELFAANFQSPGGAELPFVKSPNPEYVLKCLDNLKALVLLDGLDEIPDQDLKNTVVGDIIYLCRKLEQARLVVTCRTGERTPRFPFSSVYEIAPLSRRQIVEFSTRWLPNDREARDFVKKIEASPFYDTTIRPLALVHLFAIYERTKNIPDKPKVVYRKVLYLLLEKWDEQRSLRRMSRYANFDTSEKFEFLSALAYKVTTQFNATSFTHGQLKEAYRAIHENFALDEMSCERVLGEVESHTGILVQTEVDKFEFAHKSIQEFLTAEYIVRLPDLDGLHLSGALANECAIAISISSNPSYFLASVVFRGIYGEGDETSFLDRLLLEKPELRFCEELCLVFFHLSIFDESRRLFKYMSSVLLKGDFFRVVGEFYDFAGVFEKDGRRFCKFNRNRSFCKYSIGDVAYLQVEVAKFLSLHGRDRRLYSRISNASVSSVDLT